MNRHSLYGLAALTALALILALSGCGKKETPTSLSQPATTTVALGTDSVGMAGGVFAPQTMTASPGQEITFLNNDTVEHTVTPDAGQSAGGPNSELTYPNGLRPGESLKWTIPTEAAEGTMWYYHCRFHGKAGDGLSMGSGMAGAVVASNKATGAATPESGRLGDGALPARPASGYGSGATGTSRSTGAGTAGKDRTSNSSGY